MKPHEVNRTLILPPTNPNGKRCSCSVTTKLAPAYDYLMLFRYIVMLMTLAEKPGIHFTAIFRFKRNDWIYYDGMASPTCRPLNDFTAIKQDVGWLVYVDIKMVKEQMKSLKRELDQLRDAIPGKYWKETPRRPQQGDPR